MVELDKVEVGKLPSWNRRGGCGTKKKCEATAAPQTGWSLAHYVNRIVDDFSESRELRPKHPAKLTTPSARLRMLRDIFLIAQPPLLFQEGSLLALKFS
jgi:hypothetical protein